MSRMKEGGDSGLSQLTLFYFDIDMVFVKGNKFIISIPNIINSPLTITIFELFCDSRYPDIGSVPPKTTKMI